LENLRFELDFEHLPSPTELLFGNYTLNASQEARDSRHHKTEGVWLATSLGLIEFLTGSSHLQCLQPRAKHIFNEKIIAAQMKMAAIVFVDRLLVTFERSGCIKEIDLRLKFLTRVE
jgi:hypothetical protein